MAIETAIKFLKVEYEKAKLLKFVHNPTAYALYQVWKMADRCKSRKIDDQSLEVDNK